MADAEAKAAGTRSDAARLEAEVAAAQERISAIDARVPQLTDEKKQAGIIALDRQIQSEDRELLNNIRPEFPLDTRTEMHTRSDRMTVEYRKILAELARENSSVTPDAD